MKNTHYNKLIVFFRVDDAVSGGRTTERKSYWCNTKCSGKPRNIFTQRNR